MIVQCVKGNQQLELQIIDQNNEVNKDLASFLRLLQMKILLLYLVLSRLFVQFEDIIRRKMLLVTRRESSCQRSLPGKSRFLHFRLLFLQLSPLNFTCLLIRTQSDWSSTLVNALHCVASFPKLMLPTVRLGPDACSSRFPLSELFCQVLFS